MLKKHYKMFAKKTISVFYIFFSQNGFFMVQMVHKAEWAKGRMLKRPNSQKSESVNAGNSTKYRPKKKNLLVQIKLLAYNSKNKGYRREIYLFKLGY